jgi:putative DNA primase/helicase
MTHLPPIRQVAEALGLAIKREGAYAYIQCPAGRHEHDEKGPKCHVGGGKEIAHCFKCDWSANAVGLVKIVNGLDAKDAFAWLRERFPAYTGDSGAAVRRADPIQELADRRGWKREALAALGCTATKDGVKFPMRDERGKIVGKKVRRADGGLIDGHKSHSEKGGHLGLFLSAFPLPEGVALVTEGEPDTCAALSADWPVVVGTAGSHPGEIGERALQRLLATREAVLAPDPGESGRAWLGRVGTLLANVQCRVRYIPADAKHDLDARLRQVADAKTTLQKLASEALPWEESAGRATGEYRRTDAGNGELIAALYGDKLRFDHKRQRWLMWAEHWWRPDPDDELHRLAVEAARHRHREAASLDDKAERAAETKWAAASESKAKQDAALFLAAAFAPIADRGEGWDENPNLLGCANGVVNLATAALEEGSPDQRVTLNTGLPYLPDAGCPRWRQFLREVFAGDAELIGFVQRAVGYSLTGHTYEQCFFLCHGSGANGKSIMLGALGMVMGSYGGNTPFSTFELARRGSIPNDVAALCGKRLVTSSETTRALRLNEGRVKSLTGGDPITARFLNKEFFTFEPQFKLWLAVNDLPRVEDTSHGFWRRVRLVPFNVRFEGASEDRFLRYVLREEYPGILAWAVCGCKEWQVAGLEPPASVVEATADYQAESDPLAEFIATRCVESPEACVMGAAFYGEYLDWAHEQHVREQDKLSSRRFGEEMARRFTKGQERVANRVGMVYRGVGLIQRDEGAYGE